MKTNLNMPLNEGLVERAAVLRQMEQILNRAEAENRDLTPAEVLEYSKLEAKQELISESIGHKLPAGEGADRRASLAAKLAALDEPIDRPNPLRPAGVTRGPETAEGVVLDSRTLKAGRLAIANSLGVSSRGEFGISDFVRGVAGMKTVPAVLNALSVGTDASGGYTVPDVLMPQILEALVPASALLRAGASLVALNGSAGEWNIAMTESIPTPAWRAEAGAIAESEPTFSRKTISPKSLSFYFKVSRELLMDSPNIEQAITTVIAQAFAKELDRAGLMGSGAGAEIRGLKNVAGIHSIANGANGAALTDWGNFITAMEEILSADAPAPTAAIMHPRTLASVASFADSTGQPLRRPDALAELGLVTTSQIPTNLTVGTSADCSEVYVGDFSQFRYYMRENITILPCKELFAGTGQVAFFCHMRLDAAVLYPAAFAHITGVRP